MIKAHYSRVARNQWNLSDADARRQFRPELNREADFMTIRTPISHPDRQNRGSDRFRK